MKHLSAETVKNVIDRLEASSIDVWLDGGWGVDALVGAQTRPHADLDIIVSQGDIPRLRSILEPLGFAMKAGGTLTNFVLADSRDNELDVHAIEFDERGYGLFRLPDGRTWPFPPQAFQGSGTVDGRSVRCLSPDAQVQCHGQGYAPSESDFHDMELIQKQFGVVLPLALCRQPHTSEPSA